MELEEIYHSSSVNRTPKCLSWHGNHFIYGSSNAIVLGDLDTENQFLDVRCVLTEGHSARVNCVEWMDDSHFVSGSSDGSVVLWKKSQEIFAPLHILKNHSKSVTALSVLRLSPHNILIASVSGDSSLQISRVNDSGVEKLQSLDFGTGYALDVKLGILSFTQGKTLPVLLYSRDDSRVYLHPWSRDSFFSEKALHVFKGHEDWVQGLDLYSSDDGVNLLATSGQDCYIRIWRLCLKDEDKMKAESDIIKMEEVTLMAEGMEFVISLETILYGHEDKVYQIQWDKSNGKPSLLSCSMDKTMILWGSPDANNREGDIWTEKIRVGETGGNTLGFLGCQIGPGGSHIIGYSFNGALHYWYEEENSRWSPGVPIGGHFGSVEDIGWEREGGNYLLSVSADQTTRIHAPWSSSSDHHLWREIARPNVHGHDLSCLAVLPKHRYVLGAEEKVLRAFQATKNFLSNLSLISQKNLASNMNEFAKGASVPSLGLSNKAVFEGSTPNNNEDEEKHVKDMLPEFYFVDTSYRDPPPEETLIQNTLWPEIRKLYGHVYEVFRVAASPSGSIVASASKASQKEHASIILWDTSDWSIKDRLMHHGLTVTAMEFSPCERYFLSGSRDRSWALYERDDNESYVPMSAPSVKGKGYPHSRLIWSAGFSRDSKYFFTSSRDKKVAIWRVLSDEKAVELVTFTLLEDSVTAGTFLPAKKPDEYSLAVGLENGKVVLLSLVDGELKSGYSRRHHVKTVKKLALSSEGLLASCSSDHSVKIYKVK